MVDAGDMINDLLQTQLKESLKKGVCQVTFTKVSGEERVMLCTLY